MANAAFKLEPIPDETIFGLCIQIGVLKGAQTYSECFRLIFGKNPKRRADLLVLDSGRMDSLLQYVEVDGPEQLLKNHSVWPYFLAFQNTSVSDVLALGSQVENPFRILGQGGIQAIEEPRITKYCPVCAAEQAEKYGRTAWLRSHLLPGVMVCYKHGVALSEGNFRMENDAPNKLDIVFPSAADKVGLNIRHESVFSDVWNVENPHLLWAQISRDALVSDGLFADKSKVHCLYQGELHKRKLLVDGKYNWTEIQSTFRHHYGDLFAKQLNIDFSCDGRTDWLRMLLSGLKYYRQPSRHLLVLGALFDSLPTEQTMSANENRFSSTTSRENRPGSKKTKRIDGDRSEIRELIEKLLIENHTLTRIGLKAKLGKRTYEWVLLNDKEWLDTKIVKRSIPERTETANWHARSVKLLNSVNGLTSEQRNHVFSHGGVNRAELSRIANMSRHIVSALIERRKIQLDLQSLRVVC